MVASKVARFRSPPVIAAVIPALDEEGAIGHVVSGLCALRGPEGRPLLGEVVVADNGSRDRTSPIARAAGATVVAAPRRGYGSACLSGLGHLAGRPEGPPDIVVFVDGDGSNDTDEVPALLAPLHSGEAELVIGSRRRRAEPGSLSIPQRFGNRLAGLLLCHLYGVHTTDLGPFRAITWAALDRLEMEDPDYGWTVEMQVKAAKRGVRMREVEVANHPRRAGRSKIGGTVRGVVGASVKILGTIARHR